MPLQNRVNPFGALIAVKARGTLMGNRGCLHDQHQQIRRAFVGQRWILCLLQFRGRHRSVMSPGRYTELFFLDEATGFAAGHRPCAECQRERYRLFRDTWVVANPGLAGSATPSANDLDAQLHAERLDDRRGKRMYEDNLTTLSTGAMVLLENDERPMLVLANHLRPWTSRGYGAAIPRPDGGRVRVLTPRSIVRAIVAGFPVGLHGSARAGEGLGDVPDRLAERLRPV